MTSSLEKLVRITAVETAALDLNSRQIRALEFLLREPRLTTALYRQWNRASRATAQRDLADLLARGLLEQHGNGRGTYYVLAGRDEAQSERCCVPRAEKSSLLPLSGLEGEVAGTWCRPPRQLTCKVASRAV